MRAILEAVLICVVSIGMLMGHQAFAGMAGQDAGASQSNPDSVVPTLENIAKLDYFSTRTERLNEMLHLTPDQQAKIKPILEQESGELSVLRNNPSIPEKERLERLKKAVLKSDDKMKPVLTAEQWQNLESIRAKQKEEVKQWEKKLPKK